MPALVLIAGGSCSGKTTLAAELARRGNAAHLPVDQYYLAFDHLTLEQRRRINFDAPDAIEFPLLETHVAGLLRGYAVEVPEYDHAAYQRRARPRLIEPQELVVVEGLFALHWQALRERAALRVFVDTPGQTCLRRRLVRDTEVFGRTQEDSLARFHTHVKPAYLEHVRPTRSCADLVLDGAGNVSALADILEARALTLLTSA